MQVQALQGNTTSGAATMAAPLCVLLAHLQALTAAEPAPARSVAGRYPALTFHLAGLLANTSADQRSQQWLVNPPVALLQELLVSVLARRVVLAAPDTEERLLREWQRQQQCWSLTTIAARLLNYPEPDQAGLAAIYCMLEADNAQALPVPSLWLDLRDTLPLPHSDLRDTALLSRIVWCCHRLQRQQLRLDEPMLAACVDLLGWQEGRVRGWIEESQLALKQSCQSLGVTACLEQLQRDSLSAEHVMQEQKLQAIQQLTHVGFLQQSQPQNVDSAAELLLQIQRILLRHQLPLRFLLLGTLQEGAPAMSLLLGGDSDTLQQEFSVPLGSGRSLVSALVQQNKHARLMLSDAALAPVDRQLLRLLGSDNALCLPLNGRRTGALLLPNTAPDNSQLPHLGSLVQQLLDNHGKQAHDSSPEVALMQQQVRDVVHEAGNPLAIIKNYLQVLLLKHPELADMKEQIGFMDGEIDRITGLLQGLRHNVMGSTTIGEIDLNELVRSHHKWLAAAFSGKSALKLACTLLREPVVIEASTASVTQILLNLVKNAAEALGESGTIQLVIKRNVHFSGRLFALLEVRDDGPGMDAGRMQKLFHSGSSAKGGVHMGAGLAIVKTLVDQLQGHISCQSDGNGTTFSLLLPQVR